MEVWGKKRWMFHVLPRWFLSKLLILHNFALDSAGWIPKMCPVLLLLFFFWKRFLFLFLVLMDAGTNPLFGIPESCCSVSYHEDHGRIIKRGKVEVRVNIEGWELPAPKRWKRLSLSGDKKRRMVNALLLGSNFLLSLGLDEGATGDVRNLHPQAKPQGDCSAGLGRQHNCWQRSLHARTLFDKHADARRHDKITTSHRELGHVNPPIEPRGFFVASNFVALDTTSLWEEKSSEAIFTRSRLAFCSSVESALNFSQAPAGCHAWWRVRGAWTMATWGCASAEGAEAASWGSVAFVVGARPGASLRASWRVISRNSCCRFWGMFFELVNRMSGVETEKTDSNM